MDFETRARTITESDVVTFAAWSGDWHPQHCDASWAATSQFGERIAHGMLVLSYALGMVSFDPERVLALRAVRDAVFKRPVRLGDTIRVRGTVDDADDIGLVTMRMRVVNQRDETVVRARVEVVSRREDVEETPALANDFVPIPL